MYDVFAVADSNHTHPTKVESEHQSHLCSARAADVSLLVRPNLYAATIK